ncbi:MAG: DoxX family protein [Bryobacter sp.]|nr:DoxX family protein [Bryobacter sp.]
MDVSMPQGRAFSAALPGWKTTIGWTCAVVLGLLFILSGTWKLTDPMGWSARVVQAKAPAVLAMPLTLLVGVGETLSGVMLLIPRFRRWGAAIAIVMLVGFMAWFGFYYNDLRGADCSCFPWLKRVVGPGFFIGDAAMIALAVIGAMWMGPLSIPFRARLRSAVILTGVISVFAAVSYGMAAARQTGVPAPATVIVNGQPFALSAGRVFLYVFDPECTHCFLTAQRLSKLNWGDTKLVAFPTRVPQFAQGFLNMTKFPAVLSSDAELIKQTFPHGDPPYGVALENGRAKLQIPIFDEQEPEGKLRALGFIQ